MKEGCWINYEKSPIVILDVEDHEMNIRDESFANKLGVPKDLQKTFKKFKPREDREKFLTYIMQHSPLMRMRGHGADITFEYYSHRNKDPMEAVHEASHTYGGMLSTLNIYNLATNEVTSMQRVDFDEVLERDGYEGVMRVASRKFDARSEKIVSELLRIAKEIASS